MMRYRERQGAVRSSSIQIRVTRQELEYLKRAAADHGMTVSAYMVHSSLPSGYYPETVKSDGEADSSSAV